MNGHRVICRFWPLRTKLLWTSICEFLGKRESSLCWANPRQLNFWAVGQVTAQARNTGIENMGIENTANGDCLYFYGMLWCLHYIDFFFWHIEVAHSALSWGESEVLANKIFFWCWQNYILVKQRWAWILNLGEMRVGPQGIVFETWNESERSTSLGTFLPHPALDHKPLESRDLYVFSALHSSWYKMLSK